MNITLTITASEPILKIFEALNIQGLGAQSPEPKKVKAVTTSPAVQELPEKITLEQLRAASQAKSQAGKRDGVKGLLAKYGVDRITALATDQYEEFLAEMNAL